MGWQPENNGEMRNGNGVALSQAFQKFLEIMLNILKTLWRKVMKVLHIYQLWPVLPHQVRILLKNQSDFKLIYRKKDPKSRSKKFQDYETIYKIKEISRK